MNQKQQAIAAKLFSLMCLLIVTALFLIIVVPRLSFDFTDHGYYLYDSLLLSHGIIPIAGYGESINSVFMFFGIRQYLFYEFLYFGLVTLGITSLWVAVNKLHSLLILFLIILIGITNKASYMLSYQNGSEIYLLFAFSFFWLAQRSSKNARTIAYLFFSSVFFAFSSLANISLLPSVMTNLVLFFLFFTKDRKLMFFAFTYALISALLFYFYQNSALFIFRPGANDASLIFFIKRIPLLFEYIFISNKIYLLLITTALAIKFYSYRNRYSDCSTLRHLCFVFAILLMLIDQLTKLHLMELLYKNLSSEIIWFQLMIVALILYFDFSKQKSRFITVAGLITFSYACALAITNYSGFESHIGYLSTDAIVITALAFITEFNAYNGASSYFRISFTILLISSMIISGYYFIHHTYRSRSILAKKELITKGPLAGIRMSTSKYQAFSAIEQFYRKYDCATKLFLAYPSLPAIYPLLNHRAPYDQAWISTNVGDKSRKGIASLLQNKSHWCVVLAPEFVYAPLSFTKEAYELLSSQSSVTYTRTINTVWLETERAYYPNKLLFFVK